MRDLVEQMLKASGRRLDLSGPFVDASLPGGGRLHVVIPDITGDAEEVAKLASGAAADCDEF